MTVLEVVATPNREKTTSHLYYAPTTTTLKEDNWHKTVTTADVQEYQAIIAKDIDVTKQAASS